MNRFYFSSTLELCGMNWCRPLSFKASSELELFKVWLRSWAMARWQSLEEKCCFQLFQTNIHKSDF